MEAKIAAPLASFIDLMLDAVCVVDAKGRFVFVSAACERIFGYTPEEMIGRPMIELVAPEDRARTLGVVDEIMSGQPQFHFENRYVRKDGQLVHIMWSARWSEAEQVRIAVARDISERKRAESMQAALYAISEAAHAAEDLLALFQQIHRIIGDLLPARNFSVALHDEKNGRLSFPYHAGRHEQPSADALCSEVVRTRRPLLLTPETLAALPDYLRAAAADSFSWLGAPLNSHNGTIGALVLRSDAGGTCYTEKDKELLQFVSTQVATAIERKRLYARLQHTAQYDPLTDLPNRGLLHDRLETALARMRRQQGRMALLYIDLDKFKQVNDSFGHAAGDLLLQEVARRLKRCVRDADTVARIGGDEFVVLIESTQLPEHASLVAGKIRDALNQPVDINGHEMRVAPSIGIALYPEHGDGAEQLLEYADGAMYLAKKNGEQDEPGRSGDGAGMKSPEQPATR